MSSFPSGLSFMTVSPFSSQIQMLSSASTAMPCALFWCPMTSSPMARTSLWFWSNSNSCGFPAALR